jgi:hypothetical protein
MHSSVRAGACLCMSACACARERRRNATARPLDVCHHVCMCMCGCMHVHMCVRVDSLQACASRHINVHACVDGSASTGAHRYACICVYIERYLCHYYTYLDNVYIHITIFIPIIYLSCTCTYACMWVCTDTLRTQASMRLCAQADATRIDRCTCIQSPSVQLNI